MHSIRSSIHRSPGGERAYADQRRRSRSLSGGWFVALLVLFAALVGCKDIERRCRGVGLCEPPEPDPVVVDELFDDSVDSPLSRGSATNLIRSTLQSLSNRPGSVARFWRMGPTVSATVMLASVEVPRFGQGGNRARRARIDRFVETHTASLMHRLEPLLEGPRSRRSPLMESITRISITPAPGNLPRTLVILSDTLSMAKRK